MSAKAKRFEGRGAYRVKKEDGDCIVSHVFKTCTEVEGILTTWFTPCSDLICK